MVLNNLPISNIYTPLKKLTHHQRIYLGWSTYQSVRYHSMIFMSLNDAYLRV